MKPADDNEKDDLAEVPEERKVGLQVNQSLVSFLCYV